MKKYKIVIIILLMSLLLFLTSCNTRCEHEVIKATCYNFAYCSKCDEILGNTLEHTEEILLGKAPTCTETGLSEGKYCTSCNAIIDAQQVIEKKDHNFINGMCECGEKDPDYNDHDHEFVDGICECGKRNEGYFELVNKIKKALENVKLPEVINEDSLFKEGDPNYPYISFKEDFYIFDLTKYDLNLDGQNYVIKTAILCQDLDSNLINSYIECNETTLKIKSFLTDYSFKFLFTIQVDDVEIKKEFTIFVPHEHKYVNKRCECGDIHDVHIFLNGKCDYCGEKKDFIEYRGEIKGYTAFVRLYVVTQEYDIIYGQAEVFLIDDPLTKEIYFYKESEPYVALYEFGEYDKQLALLKIKTGTKTFEYREKN